MSDIQIDPDRVGYTLSLTDKTATEISITGGKGSNLAQLVDAGFTVPAGFCVTTVAYQTLVAAAETREAITSLENLDSTDTEQIEEISATVRERIRNTEFPDTVRLAMEDALNDISADSVAVRSSATAEDLPTASFAGQHETFLAVHSKTAVIDRVRDCMASLFTDRAVTYRLRNGIPHSKVGMAVVVQEMVEPKAAGVLFTADPVSGNRHIASVDASFGLGDAVVAGDVSPDNARVDKRTGDVLDYDVGEKAYAIRSRTDEIDGTETIAISPEEQASRVLTDAQLHTLIELGIQIEELLSVPQDIEWALVDGEFVMLQSRPITSLYPLPSPRPDDEYLHVYLSIGHQQAMAEALPPLVIDFWRSFLDDAAMRFRNPENGGVSAEAGNRTYVDLTPLLRIEPIRQRLPGALSKISEPAATGLQELLTERENDIPQRGRIESLLISAQMIRRGNEPIRSVLPRILLQLSHSLIFGLPDLDVLWNWSQSWGEEHASLIQSPQTTRDRVQAAFDHVDLVIFLQEIAPRGGTFLPGIIAGRLLRKTFPDADDELDAIGKGFEDELVTKMNQELGELADLARDTPEVLDALESGASISEIRMTEDGDAFADAFELFIDRFGHRATGEIDLSRSRWRDDPSVLLRTVYSNAKEGTGGKHREHLHDLECRASVATNYLKSQAHRGLLGPVRKWFVGRLIENYRKAVSIREFPKHAMAYVFATVHEILSEAGKTLAENGQIEQPDDVWFLRRDEVLAALNGEPINADIESRRRTHDRYVALTAPPLLTSEGEYPTGSQNQETERDTLTGTPVSSGIVEGRARVVHDPSEASLETDEILVALSTDPGWTPLFLNAGGLVMEVGGRMTHGALVAREYGIPAVASVSEATTKIQTGELIRVDGKQGTVQLLDRPDHSMSSEDRI
jgi:rifampicin phosphotransferase